MSKTWRQVAIRDIHIGVNVKESGTGFVGTVTSTHVMRQNAILVVAVDAQGIERRMRLGKLFVPGTSERPDYHITYSQQGWTIHRGSRFLGKALPRSVHVDTDWLALDATSLVMPPPHDVASVTPWWRSAFDIAFALWQRDTLTKGQP